MPSPADMPPRRMLNGPVVPLRRRESFAQGYTPTAHLVRQAKAKGFDLDTVLGVANNPLHTYPSQRAPHQRRHVGNGIAVVVDPTSRKAITAYLDQTDTALRPDQTDPDALAHERNRHA